MTSDPTLRIVHVDTGQSLRGGQRQLLLLAHGLRARGHEQTVVCLEDSVLEERARQDGFRVFSLPRHDPGHAFGILLWRQDLKLRRPHVIHAHDGRGQTLSWLASLGLPVRRVASRRVTFLPFDNWTYRWKYGRTCHAVIAVSENIKELSARAGVRAERIAVIPDGIDFPAALPGGEVRQRLRESWGCQETNFVVGLLGAATPEKGQDTALAALALLKSRLPAVRMICVSDVAAGATDSNVIQLGAVEDLDAFFPGIDLFLMPSKAEGLGSSALWAMAYGIPVVATRVGGLPEIVIENETGWLVPPAAPQAMADAIVLAASDAARLAEFGRRGRTQAEKFSAGIMTGRTEALYHRLVSPSAA